MLPGTAEGRRLHRRVRAERGEQHCGDLCKGETTRLPPGPTATESRNAWVPRGGGVGGACRLPPAPIRICGEPGIGFEKARSGEVGVAPAECFGEVGRREPGWGEDEGAGPQEPLQEKLGLGTAAVVCPGEEPAGLGEPCGAGSDPLDRGEGKAGTPREPPGLGETWPAESCEADCDCEESGISGGRNLEEDCTTSRTRLKGVSKDP